MTSPFQNPPSIPGAQPQVIGGGLQDYLPLILQSLQVSAARKQRKSEESLQSIAEGTTYGQLTPDQQKAYRRATGVKDLTPDSVVRPLPGTSDEATLGRLFTKLGIPDTSSLAADMRATLATRVATGQPHPLTTPGALPVEAKTTADITVARGQEASSFKSAVDKVTSAGQGQNVELKPGELAAYKRFNDFVPSEPVAQQLTAQTKGEIMKSALKLAANPNSASWASLFPGIKPADIIGAWGLGIGSTLDIGLSRKAELDITNAREAIQALYRNAEQVLKDTKLPYSPEMIASVMEGDQKALATPAGQLIWNTMNAGWQAALTEQTAKGDPRMIAVTKLMELAKIPQIAGNEKLLGQYSNLIQDAMASALLDNFHIEDNATNHSEMRKRTAGVFDYNWLRNFVPGRSALEVSPAGGPTSKPSKDEAAKSSATQQDMQVIDQWLKATYGDTLPSLGTPGGPGVPPQKGKAPNLFGPIP